MAKRKKTASTIGMPERLYHYAPFDSLRRTTKALEICREAIQMASRGPLTKDQLMELKLVLAILEAGVYEARVKGLLALEADHDDASA